MEFLLVLTGLAGLWLGTELTIRGAIALADRMHVSEFIIGVAVVSIGSDIPELAIAVDAALVNVRTGAMSDLIVGSALGSALGQIGFVLGAAGLLTTLTLSRSNVYIHGGMLLGSMALLGIFGLSGHVSFAEGVALIVTYVAYLAYLLVDALSTQNNDDEERSDNLAVSIIQLVIGMAIVVYGAELTVASATRLATLLDVEQSFIAIIVIGLGSSLPEFSISVSAALKRKVSLSVGNLVGSNIFDTLVPIGAAAIIAGVEFDAGLLNHELLYLFVLTIIVLALFLNKQGIRRGQASIVLGLYLAYVAIKFATV